MDPAPVDPAPVDPAPEVPESTEAYVVSIEAGVNGTYAAGYTLTGADFTVVAHYSDGNTVVNPDGYYATPLLLSAGENYVTVVFGGVSAVITVSAE